MKGEKAVNGKKPKIYTGKTWNESEERALNRQIVQSNPVASPIPTYQINSKDRITAKRKTSRPTIRKYT